MNSQFKDLEEDFFKAYKSRLKDFMELQKTPDKHETLIMHLGGVIVECYLKHLIVLKYGIKKHRHVKNTNYWYSDKSVLLIDSEGNRDKNFLKDNSDSKNPGHDLFDAMKSLTELDNIMADDRNIMKRFENIQNPLDKNKSTFIDLRYRENEYFKGTDKFETWLEDFNKVMKWLIEKSKNIEVIR